MITAILGLLTGGRITRLELYGVGIAAVVFGGWLWLRGHDAKLLAEQAARAEAAVAARRLADARQATAAEQQVADAAIKRADALAQARLEIAHAAPPPASCRVPPALLRAVGALRPGR